MKRYTLARSALLFGLVLAVGACEKGLTDANINRNAPVDVGPEFLLPQAMRSPIEMVFGAGQMLSHTAIWPQHAVQIQYPDEETGLVRASRMDAYWNTFYAGGLKDAQAIIDKGVESGDANVEAVGRIWKAWIFHVVTDLWGDVPYSQALKGEEGTIAPEYDTQVSIYTDLISQLATAASSLGSGSAGFGDGDILFGDDADAWRKFANSLRMRLAMRMSESNAGAAETEFVAAYNAGGFESNADNAMFAWPGAPYEAVLYENWTGRDDHGISEMMVNTLKSLNDPRLELYAEPATEDGEYRGLQNGLSDAPLSLAHYSRIGNFWRADGARTPTPIMTYSEVLFLQAEAAARNWIAADAATLYEEAIRANMNQWDAFGAVSPTDAEIDAYVAQASVVYGDINDIHLQKWISLYLAGPEAWSNWRRTDQPVLTPGPDLLDNLPKIPTRFEYPSDEQSLNASNLQAAVDRQGGGNDLITNLWWDMN